MFRSHVLICGGTGCHSSHSDRIKAAFDAELKANVLKTKFKFVMTGCFGLCAVRSCCD